VQLKRYSLGIPQCWEDRRPWTPKEDALLGTKRDRETGQAVGSDGGVGADPSSSSDRYQIHPNAASLETSRNYDCSADYLILTSPDAPGVLWLPCATSAFSLELRGTRRSVDGCQSLRLDVGEEDDAFPKRGNGGSEEVAERQSQAPNGSAARFAAPLVAVRTRVSRADEGARERNERWSRPLIACKNS